MRRTQFASTATARDGFTLVEVMVVLLIMSGILVTITQVLNSARSTRDVIHNVAETQLAGPAILDHLERDLRAVFLYSRDPAFALFVEDRTLSGYDADSIQFATSINSLLLTDPENSNSGFRRADYNEVGYVLRPNPDAPNDFLEIYRREGFGIDDSPFEEGRYAFLHDRVKGFDIQVFDEGGDEAEPLDDWGDNEERLGLPERIEISLTLELAPRLVREKIRIAPVDKRTVTYRRVIRFPASLARSLDLRPVPLIPDITPPVPGRAPGQNAGAGGPGEGDGTTDGEDPGIAPGGGFGGFDGESGGTGGGGGLDLGGLGGGG